MTDSADALNEDTTLSPGSTWLLTGCVVCLATLVGCKFFGWFVPSAVWGESTATSCFLLVATMILTTIVAFVVNSECPKGGLITAVCTTAVINITPTLVILMVSHVVPSQFAIVAPTTFLQLIASMIALGITAGDDKYIENKSGVLFAAFLIASIFACISAVRVQQSDFISRDIAHVHSGDNFKFQGIGSTDISVVQDNSKEDLVPNTVEGEVVSTTCADHSIGTGAGHVTMTSPLQVHVVGKATAPDFRYELDVEQDGCKATILVNAGTLSNIVEGYDVYGPDALARVRAGNGVSPAVKAEAASVAKF